MSLTEKIREYAFSLGFDLVGFTSADSFEHGEKMLKQWVNNGYAGEMKYMERSSERRASPKEILPGANSIISLAMNYYQPDDKNETLDKGKIAKYARGKDYHEIIDTKLELLEKFIHAQGNGEIVTRRYVDTGPLLEREIAQRAGLGFIGKNTNLITRKFGSWVFLAEILTSLELDYDKPARGTCGKCTLCIDSCPTQAIVDSNQVDSRLCISYLTIELKHSIPEKLRSLMGDWLFGCDICQDVCPFNHSPKNTGIPEFKGNALMDLKNLLLLREDKEFKDRFKNSPMSRPKRKGLLRNASVVVGNSKDKSFLPIMENAVESDSSELVKEHVQWAIGKLK